MIDRSLANQLNAKRVLLVDDEKFSRNIVFRMLKDMGCEDDPLMASDGAAGLATLSENRHAVGLAVCDFNMPVMNGLEFLKAVRTAIDGLPNALPIVMLTGHADAALVGTALALDVDAFVLKPVSRTALETRLKRIFAQPQGVKAPTHYAGVDVAAAATAVLRARHGIPEKKVDGGEAVPGVAVELDAITLPAVLAADITAPTGELLLGAGVSLTPRLLDRLKELRAMGIVPERVHLRDDGALALKRA
jgi:CheY-like chemotaxis protein